jgi:hypothetical protein
MYVKQEAVFSSRIEATQSTLEDVLEFEARLVREKRPKSRGSRELRPGHESWLRAFADLPLSLMLLRSNSSDRNRRAGRAVNNRIFADAPANMILMPTTIDGKLIGIALNPKILYYC